MIETKKRSLILNIILGVIIVVIAVLFWPTTKRSEQSNKVDPTKTQMRVIVKRVNIRKEPDIKSDDIGDVFEDEVYTILDHIDKEDYYWYHINTSNGIDGYVGSNPKEEYVEILSGYLDRTAPVINVDRDMFLFVNGVEDFSGVSCKDEYSSCKLAFDKIPEYPEYIILSAQDEDHNIASQKVKYYEVYDIENEFNDSNGKVNSKFVKSNDKNTYTISAEYTITKNILNENKSNSYTPIINLYDKDMKEIKDVYIRYNKVPFGEDCINTETNSLISILKDQNLITGTKLCMNFTFENPGEIIKYFAVGFSSDENYTNKDNYLASYYSKYFILN